MTTLKGIFPDPKPRRRKNFIHENVKSLRRLEQNIHKDIEEFQKPQKQKANGKYQNVTARVSTSVRDRKRDGLREGANLNDKDEENQQRPRRKISAPVFNKRSSSTCKKALTPLTNSNGSAKHKKREQDRLHKVQHDVCTRVSSDPNVHNQQDGSKENTDNAQVTKYKSQGVQTLDEKHMDNLYAEGIIRYPTKKCTKQKEAVHKDKFNHQGNETRMEQSNLPSDRGDICVSKTTPDVPKVSESPHQEVDHIKLNKERVSVACKLATQLNNGIPPPNYRKGVVPKYIRDRKEAQQREQKAKAEASNADCPEGHVSLPDNERRETLRMLKKNYQDYVNELNMMPIKTDTLRAQRRKMEIEKELNKIEEGIKVFSKPKVCVKVNA